MTPKPGRAGRSPDAPRNTAAARRPYHLSACGASARGRALESAAARGRRALVLLAEALRPSERAPSWPRALARSAAWRFRAAAIECEAFARSVRL